MSSTTDGVDELADELDRRLADDDAVLAAEYPGQRAERQPVHTVYVPADRFDAGTVASWGAQAREALAPYSSSELARVLDLPPELVEELLPRVRAKLEREPIEDLRVDFEDGYGTRPGDQEDADVAAAARALAAGERPPYFGIRFKSFEAATRRRGLRTLALFLGELGAAGAMPGAGVPGAGRPGAAAETLNLTLPKVTSVAQVEAMVLACERLETQHGLPRLRFEIQVETPQSILGADGTALVARMIHAAQGRCSGLHYGTYDYSASCGIAAAYQSMEHPAADHAKAVMQAAAANTGVFVSDGSTNVLPVGSRSEVEAAWALHARLVRRSLERGFYQGWDLHPAQLPTRYLATYAFFRSGLPAAASRLRAYVEGGASGYLDEPATAAALAGFVLRGVECGAVSHDEVAAMIGVDEQRLAVLARRPR